MKVQNGCLWVEEAEDSVTTEDARNFFFAQKMSHDVLEEAELFPCRKTAKKVLLAAKVAFEENGCCPGIGRTRRSPLGGGDRGGAQQQREPTQKQAAPSEALEQGFKKSEHGGRLNTTMEGPTKLVVYSAS
ncbi:hypothetical protein NDU88_005761 [Pleurodeles waltl]|uniref:Uncharacterized protein n=1 Tax=Pleurodeles waltl TaxID=8319 RepID=A0AAV7TWC6_PLEWA|nr:hypothetical protein NDU88_005761 [Pleurodeles waltl]